MNDYILRTQPPDRLDVSDLLHTIQDLSFCDSQENTPKMDLYFPDESAEPRPVILNVCGGGWYFGIPTSAHLKRTLHTAVQRGYVFASIACTSSRYQKFPYQVWEVKTAIRYLRANAEAYHLNPNRIALWSASSGAHLSLMAALTCGIPEFDDPVLGYPGISCQVPVVVAAYPPSELGVSASQFQELGISSPFPADNADSMESIFLGEDTSQNPALARKASPLTYIHPDAPYLYLQHGSIDDVVPITQSRRFAEKYEELAGKDKIQTEFITGAGHSDPIFKTEATCHRILDTIDQWLTIASLRSGC